MRESNDAKTFSSSNKLQVGLIIGGGTGGEIAKVFRRTIEVLCEHYNIPISLIEFEGRPKTYFELANLQLSSAKTKEIEKAECDDIWRFLGHCDAIGCSAIFRTAVNAGTLYRLRARLRSVKTMLLCAEKRRMLLVRDQFQGFYALEDDVENDDLISFGGSYSRESTESLIKFALARAEALLSPDFRTLAIYKHHLFANFHRWFLPFPRIELLQPDSGIDLLMHEAGGRDILIIASNEVGDTLTEYLPLYYRIGSKKTMFAKNSCLDPAFSALTIYQTIHGSADNIAGRGIVNPLATMRAAASILKDNCGIHVGLEEAINQAAAIGCLTPDEGGQCGTAEVVDLILGAVTQRM